MKEKRKQSEISDISGPDLIERIEKQTKYASSRHDELIEAQKALDEREGKLGSKEELKKSRDLAESRRKNSEYILTNLNKFKEKIEDPNTDPRLRENLLTIYNNKELDNSTATTRMDLAENTYLLEKERAQENANYFDWSHYGGVSGKSRKRKSIRKKNKKTLRKNNKKTLRKKNKKTRRR